MPRPCSCHRGLRGAQSGRDGPRRSGVMRGLWILVVPILVMAIAASAFAGGRARVTALHAPDQVVAGRSFDLTFDVRPELGRRREIEPIVRATLDGTEVAVTAVRVKGGYAARLTLPKAGDWQVRVDSRYCETVM